MKEFNLSEQRCHHNNAYHYTQRAVKKFIKKIEGIIVGNPHARQMLIELHEIAGEKLT